MDYSNPIFLLNVAINFIALGAFYGAVKVEIKWLNKSIDELKTDFKTMKK